MALPYRYSAFGLVVESSFEFPELQAAPVEAASSDITVEVSRSRFPAVSTSGGVIPPALIVLQSSRLELRVDQGRRIEVWEGEGADREFTRAVLLGVGFAAALFQRGDWPLHVSAVAVGEVAWLFGGRSGAGKSTIASLLHTGFGLPLVADDSGVVRLGERVVRFSAASRAVRLFPDALSQTFSQASGAEGLAVEIPAIDRKVRVRLSSRLPDRQLPVHGLVMLDDLAAGEKSRVTPLRGARALEAIRLSIYRPWLGQYMCSAADAFRFCAEFHRRVPVYAFARNRNFESSFRDLEPLLNLMRTSLTG